MYFIVGRIALNEELLVKMNDKPMMNKQFDF